MTDPETPSAPSAPQPAPEPSPPQPRSPMHVPDEINELVRKPPRPDDEDPRADD